MTCPPAMSLCLSLSLSLSLTHTHTHTISQKQTNVKTGKAFLFFRTPSSYRIPDCRISNVALKSPKKKRKARTTTITDELECMKNPTSQQNAWPEDSTLDGETETQNSEREREREKLYMQEMATAVSRRELSANPGRQDHLQLCLSLDTPRPPAAPRQLTTSSPNFRDWNPDMQTQMSWWG
jgi:hypothetical protein